MAFKAYKSYNFVDKDPVLDLVRAIVEDSHKTVKSVCEDSGVSTTTVYHWFNGKTRRPMFSTIAAVSRACGKDVRIGGTEVVSAAPEKKKRGRKRRSAALPLQAAA